MGLLAIVHVLVLLVLGLAVLGVGVLSAVRPLQQRLELLRVLTWAVVFASVGAILSGLSLTAVGLARAPMTPELAQSGWAGIAEAAVPGIFGFGVLTVAWGLAAVGLRRQD
jgi:hypothetical protein